MEKKHASKGISSVQGMEKTKEKLIVFVGEGKRGLGDENFYFFVFCCFFERIK